MLKLESLNFFLYKYSNDMVTKVLSSISPSFHFHVYLLKNEARIKNWFFFLKAAKNSCSVITVKATYEVSIRYPGEGKVCFFPPLFCPTNVSKKKPAAGEKILRSLFSKKLTFLGKFNGF